MKSRPDELREEAGHLMHAASFLIVSAARKIELAQQIERLDRAGTPEVGGLTPPPCPGHISRWRDRGGNAPG